jgi:lantibiotic biosynthesis protein
MSSRKVYSEMIFLPSLVRRHAAFSHLPYNIENLENEWRSTYLQKALELASPTFFQTIYEKSSVLTQLRDKEKLSLFKYINRMYCRPTPFGLFAAVGLCNWSSSPNAKPDISVPPNYELFVNKKPNNKASYPNNTLFLFPLFINPSLYKLKKEIRYIRYEEDDTGQLLWEINTVDNPSLILEIEKFCRKGKSFAELKDWLIRSSENTEEEIIRFIIQLVEVQLLIVHDGRNLLQKSKISNEPYPLKYTIPASVLQQEKDSANKDIVSDELNYIKQHHYVNLYNQTITDVNLNYQRAIKKGIHCLDKLVDQVNPSAIQDFVKQFEIKFDQRAIPLLMALDATLGMSYTGPQESMETDFLIDYPTDLQLPKVNEKVSWTPAHSLMLRKIQEATTRGLIDITDEDLFTLPECEDKMPPGLAIMFRITAEEQVYLEEIGSVSATALLGRFTEHVGIYQLSKEIARKEEGANPEVIFAEINCRMESKYAIVNKRHAVYSYTIPIGYPATEPGHIPLNDLWLYLVDDELVLWSKKLKKRIIPRLSSAFNYTKVNLPIYRFLCDLQFYNLKANYTLNLSALFPGLFYYPRVAYKQSILVLASWHFSVKEAKQLKKSKQAENLIVLQRIIAQYHWPQWISLVNADQQLVFNLREESQQMLLLDCVKPLDTFIIREHPFIDSETKYDDASHSSNQYIAAVYNKEPRHIKIRPPGQLSALVNIKRSLQEWLYFKIYCYPGYANTLLTDFLYPMVCLLRGKNMVEKWFFIRYQDPDHHLRFRIKIKDSKGSQVFKRVSKLLHRLTQNGFIYSYKSEAYDPEVSRYGIYTLKYAEEVFYADSEYCIQLLRHYSNDKESLSYAVIQTVDLLFTAIGYTIKERLNICTQLALAGMLEHDYDGRLKQQADQHYRQHRNQLLNQLLNRQLPIALQSYQSVFNETIAVYLNKTEAANRQLRLHSLIHMYVNRIFSQSQRLQEAVIYHWLHKFYAQVYHLEKAS